MKVVTKNFLQKLDCKRESADLGPEKFVLSLYFSVYVFSITYSTNLSVGNKWKECYRKGFTRLVDVTYWYCQNHQIFNFKLAFSISFQLYLFLNYQMHKTFIKIGDWE